MRIPGLTEGYIRRQATAESFRRGQNYWRNGAVRSLVQRGNLLRAEVEGSQYEPYQVRVAFDRGGIVEAACTCPFTWGGWCKHTVAVLLVALHNPAAIDKRPTLDKLLTDLDEEHLQDLLLRMAANDPSLADEIERQAALLHSEFGDARDTAGTAHTPRHTEIDPQSIRRQVSAALHSLDRMRRFEAYSHVSSVVNQVGQVLDKACAFLQAGDGENALTYLEAITDEYVEGWLCLDDSDGYASEFFATLGVVWTEAALVADLVPAERHEWANKLTQWQAKIGDYGMEEAFDAAQAAFLHGWDHPLLQQILQGASTIQSAWEGEPPWFAGDLTAARLKILEQQGRHEEYLRLARAEGQYESRVLMLARLGRVQEAADEAVQHLHEPAHLLALAVALRDAGALAEALRVAEHGLTLDGYKAGLATWLCDLATGLGKKELALRAALAGFQSAPRLEGYLRIQELAGRHWPKLKQKLLAHLCREDAWSQTEAQVQVFLHEGMLDDAIAAVEEDGTYSLIEQVMDAVLAHRPGWVIRTACEQAERIVDAGRAQHYHHAVGWLERARNAYRAAGREEEWRAYLAEIRNRHGRKYKLMGMLEDW